jgi:hypothetical protein
MSEELVVLKSYVDTLGLDLKNLKNEDLLVLIQALEDGDEMGLVGWVSSLNSPSQLLDYVGEEE